MIFAEQSIWRSAGEQIIWVAAVVTALGVISRTRPAKWLFRQLIGKPITEWGIKVVSQVVDEKVSEKNGGSSLRDRVDDIAKKQENLSELTHEAIINQDDLRAAINNIHSCLDKRFADTHSQIEKLIVYIENVLVDVFGSKERIRHLYRFLDIPIFETDAKGWCTYVNPSFCKLTGLTVEHSLGEGWLEAVYPDDRLKVLKTWETAVKSASELTVLFRIKNLETNQIVETRTSATPLHDGQQNVVGWIGMLDLIEQETSLGRTS
jgi:PAS domain S-box-containing protein